MLIDDNIKKKTKIPLILKKVLLELFLLINFKMNFPFLNNLKILIILKTLPALRKPIAGIEEIKSIKLYFKNFFLFFEFCNLRKKSYYRNDY